jgi:uncharacterized protein with GYD domain
MNTYIVIGNYTDKGVAAIKQSPKRRAGVRTLLKKLGGRMKDFYLTMGGPDLVVIVELPSDEAAARFALTVASAGFVRTTTLKAFPEKDYHKIIESI